MKPEQDAQTGEGTQGKIAERAYRIWEAEGKPSGREMEHWLRAEAEAGAEEETAALPKMSASREK